MAARVLNEFKEGDSYDESIVHVWGAVLTGADVEEHHFYNQCAHCKKGKARCGGSHAKSHRKEISAVAGAQARPR